MSQLGAKLIAICSSALRGPVSMDDDMMLRGMNANRGLAIIREFWLETGIELDVNAFIRHRTIAELLHAIAADEAHSQAKCVTLRPGDLEKPLFLYAGGASCFLELRDLYEALDYRGAVIGLCLTDFQAPDSSPADMQMEIAASLACVRALQPSGPYRIAGFSFGGVFALELARRLRAEGEQVSFLAMLDSPMSDHALPLRLWLHLMGRTLSRQIRGRIADFRKQGPRPASSKQPTTSASDAFAHSPARRGHQLLLRFRNPRKPDYPFTTPQWAGGYPPRYNACGKQLLRLKALYRPQSYPGLVHFFVSTGGSPIDCASDASWRPYLPKAEWIKVGGNHISMLVARHGRMLASMMSARLAAAERDEA